MFQEIGDLLKLYCNRKDLQDNFPEVQDGNLKRFINWGLEASQRLFEDNAYEILKNYSLFYLSASKYDNFIPHPNFKDLPEVFFIFGASRSGSSLLKRILNSHSMISVVHEGLSYDAISYPTMLKLARIFDSDKKWLGLHAVGITDCLENYYMPFPGPYEETIGKSLRTLYQNQPIIFLIRDVRDRVSSLWNMILKTNSDLYGMTLLYSKWIHGNSYTKHYFAEEIEKIEKTEQIKNKLLAYLSLDWKIKNSMFFRYIDNNYNLLKVKYEDLVSETKNTLLSITNFLNTPFEEAMLDFYKKPQLSIPGTDLESNFDNVKRNVDVTSIGLHTKFLNPAEIDEIMSISSDMMIKLGYKI